MSYISILRAVFISSLAALPSSLLLFAYEGSLTKNGGWIELSICILIVSIVGCLVIGLPVHFAMQKRNINNRFAYAFMGFLAPLVIIALGPIITMDLGELIDRTNIEVSLVFAIAGSAVAVTLRETMRFN